MSDTSSAASGRERIPLGIAWMVLTIFLFVSLDTLAKYLLQFYPVTVVVWARFTFHFTIALAVLFSTRRPRLRSARPGLQILRSLTLMMTTTLFFIGVHTTPIATATSIMFLAPIVLTALSVPLLGEHVGPRRWAGVAIGFLGALVIVRPGLHGVSAGSLFLLGAACLNATYQIFTRLIRNHDDPLTTLAWSAIAGSLAASALLPFDWQAPDASGWVLLVLAGALGVAGHLCLILALRSAPASAVAPFSYTGLIWATGFGYLVFREVPDVWTLVGAAMIISSGLYIFHRERVVAARK